MITTPSFRFGKHPPKQDYRTILLSDYVAPNVPPHPVAYNVLDRIAPKADKAAIAALFPMDGNDRYGDCTCAGMAHASTVYHALIGKHVVPTEKATLKVYMHLTGGIDSGLNMLDVLNYWHKTSFGSEKIVAFAKVNVKKPESVKQAIHLFGGCYLGFQVPQNCMQQFSAGEEWTPGRLTNDGHCVYAIGYDDEGVDVLTWGARQRASWAWWTECVDEAYAILPVEAKNAAFAPGFDFAALQADLSIVVS